MRMRTVIIAAALAIGPYSAAQEQAPDPPLRISAFAVNLSNIATGAASAVDIAIDRWSTDTERQQLIAAFTEKGPDAMLSALQKTKRVGYIRLPNSIGYDLHFARKHPGQDGGAQIILVTDRRIGYWESTNQARTMDYPFTLLDIRVNAKGEGEGKLSLATKIRFNQTLNTLEVENYASEPVRLQNVRVEGKKK